MTSSFRAVFNWVSKVIRVLLWFYFTSLCDWLKNLATLSRPANQKENSNQSRLARTRFSRAYMLHVFASSSDWFIGEFVFVVIGWGHNFDFGFTTLIWEALYYQNL